MGGGTWKLAAWQVPDPLIPSRLGYRGPRGDRHQSALSRLHRAGKSSIRVFSCRRGNQHPRVRARCMLVRRRSLSRTVAHGKTWKKQAGSPPGFRGVDRLENDHSSPSPAGAENGSSIRSRDRDRPTRGAERLQFPPEPTPTAVGPRDFVV